MLTPFVLFHLYFSILSIALILYFSSLRIRSCRFFKGCKDRKLEHKVETKWFGSEVLFTVKRSWNTTTFKPSQQSNVLEFEKQRHKICTSSMIELQVLDFFSFYFPLLNIELARQLSMNFKVTKTLKLFI